MSFGAVIIGSDLARRLWGDADPLGRRLALAESTRPEHATQPAPLVVVGIVDEAAPGPSDVHDQIRAYVPSSVAVWIPARRASTVDPVVALRTE